MNKKFCGVLALVWAANCGFSLADDNPENDYVGYVHGGIALMWAGLGIARGAEERKAAKKAAEKNIDKFDIM